MWFAIVALAAAIGAILFQRHVLNSPDRAFRQFWAPIVDSPKPVLICMGSNAVYRLSNQFLTQYLAENHQETHNCFDFFAVLPSDRLIEARNIQRDYNSFVALGDVAAVSDIVADLTRQGKPFKQRFPPDISFAELDKTPTITVGGFNNPLTMYAVFALVFASHLRRSRSTNTGSLSNRSCCGTPFITIPSASDSIAFALDAILAHMTAIGTKQRRGPPAAVAFGHHSQINVAGIGVDEAFIAVASAANGGPQSAAHKTLYRFDYIVRVLTQRDGTHGL